MYIYQQQVWPEFRWDIDRVYPLLVEVRHNQGRLLGRMEALGSAHSRVIELGSLSQDVLKTSEIEGELLDRDQVRSSVARRLGLEIAGSVPSDSNVDGVVEMLMDATRQYAEPLTQSRLFEWHRALFPSGSRGLNRILIGQWRDEQSGPMQVVSGRPGREKVHFEAPDAESIPDEMNRFLDWFNADLLIDPVLKSALSHLWFVTIHPFDDGNGRIARAISDMMLARSENSPHRFYSLSAQIRIDRSDYYIVLERTQKGPLDVTEWLEWFLGCMDRAIHQAGLTLTQVLFVTRFWDDHRQDRFNDRQRKLIGLMMEGFDGKLTTSKWAKIAKCSQDSAWRDISDLMDRGILRKENSGGRSTHYTLIQ